LVTIGRTPLLSGRDAELNHIFTNIGRRIFFASGLDKRDFLRISKKMICPSGNPIAEFVSRTRRGMK
jgi:hypothetical protein